MRPQHCSPVCRAPHIPEVPTGIRDAKVGGVRQQLAAPQDEHQFQVVSDRARWINIAMGSQCRDDAGSTERKALRQRLASATSDDLTFRLVVRL